MLVSTPVSSTQERWQRRRWIAPVLVAIVGVLNVIHSPGPELRVMGGVFLLCAVIVLGRVLYANAREARRQRDLSHGT
jgi:hypothetical protein